LLLAGHRQELHYTALLAKQYVARFTDLHRGSNPASNFTQLWLPVGSKQATVLLLL
jgi:hypothetical protein